MKKTKLVELTMEETGWLCHLILPALVELEKAAQRRDFMSTIMTPAVYASVHARVTALYAKLADANDDLMGKKP